MNRIIGPVVVGASHKPARRGPRRLSEPHTTGRPAANSWADSPTGAVDNEAISDDGDAGMTHFGSDQQGVGTSMSF